MELWIPAALGTAAAFALSSLIAYEASRALGAIVFSFLRMSIVTMGFAAWLAVFGFDPSIGWLDASLLALSGILGVLFGDAFRYAALARIGPRLQSLVHTANVPFVLVFGVIFLSQAVVGLPLLGTGLVFAGIVLAVAFRARGTTREMTGDPDRVASGISFGLAAALAQAASILVAAPVMLKGVDPISASAIRIAAGTVSIVIPALWSATSRAQLRQLSAANARRAVLCALIGPGIGMTLLLYALATGPAGIVSTLASTTPILLVPMVWAISRVRPAGSAWVAAVCCVAGVGLIML